MGDVLGNNRGDGVDRRSFGPIPHSQRRAKDTVSTKSQRKSRVGRQIAHRPTACRQHRGAKRRGKNPSGALAGPRRALRLYPTTTPIQRMLPAAPLAQGLAAAHFMLSKALLGLYSKALAPPTREREPRVLGPGPK